MTSNSSNVSIPLRRKPYRVELRQPNGDDIFIRDYYKFIPEPTSDNELKSPDYLGSGASAQVFRGTCVKTGLSVAIKRISKKNNKSREIGRVVGQEWLTNCRVQDSSHIVNLIQLVETTNYIYFVQELMGSELFDAVIEANPGGLSELQARQATRSLLLGLRHLHDDLGVIHRDIKPENLLLPYNEPSNFNGLKLADLGFCSTPQNATTFMGTEAYCPGEVLCGNETTFASDMWSVGVCLYIMLCGYPPFYTNKKYRSERRSDLRDKIIKGAFQMGGIEWEGRTCFYLLDTFF
jgi:serine/threonine protein kinase